MKESGYYPPGAEFDSQAPWNYKEPKPMNFYMSVSQSLSKSVKVLTSDYEPVVEKEMDDTGGYYYETQDTSNTDWKAVYENNRHETPMKLIEILKEMLIMYKEHGLIFGSPAYTEHLIEECDNWTDDETEFIGE